MQEINKLSDEKLLNTFTDWFRIYRNEGVLEEKERKYFQDLCAEIRKRKLIDFESLKDSINLDTKAQNIANGRS